MSLVSSYHRKKTIFLFLRIGLLAGVIYPIFSDGFQNPVPFINGLLIGGIGGLTIALLETTIFNPKQRKYSFFAIVSLKVITYFILLTILVICIKAFNDSIYYGESFLEHLKSQRFQNFVFQEDLIIILLYALIIIGVIIFSKQMSLKMGQGELNNMLTGRYAKPKEVQRIFLFLDLKSCTTIAEKLGPIKYHELLNDFFFDVTASILRAHGKIYRYVGDQVVVSWSSHLKDYADSIRLYFYAKRAIEKQQEKYLSKYALVPDFRACIHYGTVVKGEIGVVKSQVVYHGEVLYENALIEKKCSELNEDILVSEDLMKHVKLPDLYKAEKVDVLHLTNRNLSLFRVYEDV